jgi:hypothetical protein
VGAPIVRLGNPLDPYAGDDRHRQQHQQQDDEAQIEAEDAGQCRRCPPTSNRIQRQQTTNHNTWSAPLALLCASLSASPQAVLGLRLDFAPTFAAVLASASHPVCALCLALNLAGAALLSALCVSRWVGHRLRLESLGLRIRLRACLRLDYALPFALLHSPAAS